MVVAAAAPLTVVAGTVPIGIAVGNGAGFPLIYIVCSAILMLFAVGFTTMTRHIPNAGGFYAYIGQGLGRSAGLGSAFLAVLSYTAVLVAVYGYIGAALGDLVDTHLGISMSWWVWSGVILVAVSMLGYRQIDLSSKVLGVLLVGEVAVVMVIDVFIVGKGGGATGLSTGLVHLQDITSGAPGIAIMFALAGFLGFEATVVFRDEARDPDRTIPRATYLSLLLIGGFYALSSWAMVSAWGDKGSVARATADPGTMLAETAQIFVGRFASDLVNVLLVTSLMAAVLSFHNVTARYLFSLGNSGVLPGRWGHSHGRHGSPHIASMIVTGVAGILILLSALAGLDPVAEVFAWLAGIATVGVLALMLLTCLAVVVFFRRTRVDVRAWQTLVAPLLGLAALAVSLYLTVSNLPTLVGGSDTLAFVIGGILLGSLLAGPVVAFLRPGASAHSAL
ncbi:MAG: APC family permease [Actinomycetota bacterium]|nr:APC family permease [Actinomycetota bacterium]